MTVDEVSLKDWINKKGIRRAEPNYMNDPKVREKYKADTTRCPMLVDGFCNYVPPSRPGLRFNCTGLYYGTCNVYLSEKNHVE